MFLKQCSFSDLVSFEKVGSRAQEKGAAKWKYFQNGPSDPSFSAASVVCYEHAGLVLPISLSCLSFTPSLHTLSLRYLVDVLYPSPCRCHCPPTSQPQRFRVDRP